SDLTQLAGWMAFDAGQHGLAQRYFFTGLRAAHDAGYRAMEAHILRTCRSRPPQSVTPTTASFSARQPLEPLREHRRASGHLSCPDWPTHTPPPAASLSVNEPGWTRGTS